MKKIKSIFGVVLATATVFCLSIIVADRISAASTYEERPDECGNQVKDGITLFQGNFESYVNGSPASFRVEPVGVGSIKAIVLIPDNQVDVGAGAGNERTIGIERADGSFFMDGKYHPTYPAIEVKATGATDDDKFLSTLRFAIRCRVGGEERTIDLCVAVGVRIHFEGETSPSVNPTGFYNACPTSGPTNERSGNSSSSPQAPNTSQGSPEEEEPDSVEPSAGEISIY